MEGKYLERKLQVFLNAWSPVFILSGYMLQIHLAAYMCSQSNFVFVAWFTWSIFFSGCTKVTGHLCVPHYFSWHFNYPVLQYLSFLCSSSLGRCGHHCTHTALPLTTMFSLCPSEIDALNSLHNFTFKYGQPMWEQLSKYVALAQIFLKN